MKILIIDDDAPLRGLIAEILQQQGWDVLEAPEGGAGMEKARQHLPDLILCDFEMDGLNGFQTLAGLRNDPATASIPFILMTGADAKAGMRRSMNLGADDYLTKPFDPGLLLKVVAARVERAQLSRRQAEEKLATLRTAIIAALPHELKTPLNGILGYAEMLHKDIDSFSRDELRSIAGDMYQSASRLNRLVDRFLYYAELQATAVKSPPARAAARTDPDEMKVTLEDTLRPLARDVGRAEDLRLQLGEGVPQMDLPRLARLASELVDNACKFSPPGSFICLAAGARGGRFVLEVRDTGRGLTPEQIRNAGALMQFDRLRYEQQGAGLGLAIVRLLAELSGGTMVIASQPGSGTTVAVSLPLATDAAAMAEGEGFYPATTGKASC